MRNEIIRDLPACSFGVNLGWNARAGNRDFVPFVNQLKMAQAWVAVGDNATGFVADADGYITTMPSGGQVRSDILHFNTELASVAPFSGNFRFYGRGIGELSYDDGAWTSTTTLPTETINGVTYWYMALNYTPASTAKYMKLRNVVTADYPRDMALVHTSRLENYRAGEIFDPVFLADMVELAPSTIRYMNAQQINQTETTAAAYTAVPRDYTVSVNQELRYVPATSYSYHKAYNLNRATQANYPLNHLCAIPLEIAVALCNELGADLWTNFPVDVTDARVTTEANYIKANLVGKAIFEFGNELWNSGSGFEGYQVLYAKANVLWPTKPIGDFYGQVGLMVATRQPQIRKLLDTAFGSTPFSMVLPGWAAAPPVSPSGSAQTGAYVRKLVEASAYIGVPANATKTLVQSCDLHAIGPYWGFTLDQGLSSEVVANYLAGLGGTDLEKAARIAKYLQWGWNANNTFEVTSAHLTTPLKVRWSSQPHIGLYGLIRADFPDVSGAANPAILTSLSTVIRVNGNNIEYKGAAAASWTVIVQGEGTLSRTLDQLVNEDFTLTGWGYNNSSVYQSGARDGLGAIRTIYIDQHYTYVTQTLGMKLVGYEGGPHLWKAPTGLEGVWTQLSNSVVQQGTLARFMHIMRGKMELFCYFQSHNGYYRYDSGFPDNWGLKDRIGETSPLHTQAAKISVAAKGKARTFSLPSAPAAPAFSVQPSIYPTTGIVDTTQFRLFPGSADRATKYDIVWKLDGVALSGKDIKRTAGEGTLTATVTASNRGGSVSATTAGVTVKRATADIVNELVARFDVAPSATRKGHITTFVTALNDADIWARLKGLWVMVADTVAIRNLDWKGGANLVANGGAGFTVRSAFVGDGVDDYLLTGYAPASDRQNDIAIGVECVGGAASGTGWEFGNNLNRIQALQSSTTARGASMSVASFGSFAATSATGLTVLNRPSSTTFSSYKNGAKVADHAVASTAPTGQALTIGCYRNGSSVATGFSTRPIRLALASRSLTDAQIATLNTAIATLLTNLSVPA